MAHLAALRSATAIERKDEVVIFVVRPFSPHIGECCDAGRKASAADRGWRWLEVVERHGKDLLLLFALSN
jgi:hypothetical protein